MRGGTLGLLAFLALAVQSGPVLAFQKAADFAAGGPWFNTGGRALSIHDLRGKVVAVEMWTAG